MAQPVSGQRIRSKTTLIQAIEIIASDRIKDSSKKPARWVYRPHAQAQRILLKVIAPDANIGWQVLRSLDNMNMYGDQIPLAFEYCINERDLFVHNVVKADSKMLAWVDKQRRKQEGDLVK
jgi:hypothetical protein